MATTKASAKNAQNTINVNATATKAIASNSQKATATEKARENAEKAKARENAKAAKAIAKKAEKAEKYVFSQVARVASAKAKADTKSAISYNAYGVIKAEANTPFSACKRFYIALQTACGGAVLQVVSHVIGNDKRDFAERYAGKVREIVEARQGKNYSDFAVWRALWPDLQKLTNGALQENPQIITACKQIAAAVAERAEIRKAEKAAK